MKNTFLSIITTFILITGLISPDAYCKTESLQRELREIERAMIAEGNYGEAVVRLNAMLESAPGDPRVYMDLGNAHYGLMEYGTAYEYFKKAEKTGVEWGLKDLLSYVILKMDENRDILWKIEGAKNAMEGKGEAAQRIEREEIATGHFAMLNEFLKGKYYYPAIMAAHIIWLKENMPYLPGLYRLSGDIYYSAMFYREAAEDYRKAIEEEPGDTRLYRTLADCLVATGDFDGAQEYYNKAIGLYKERGFGEKDPEVQRLRRIERVLPKTYKDITVLIEEKRFSEAEDICRKRISLNPGDYAAITQLGQIYWEKKQRRAAIRLFRKVSRLVPDYPLAHFFLGKAYVFERKPEKGIAEFNVFKEKMEMLPEMDENTTELYISALHYISYMYSTLKRYEDTKTECEKIIELDPDDQMAHYNLAVCYFVYYHNRSKAYRELQKVIEIDPDTRMADTARYYIDYMRSNPDSRFISDFTFVYEE